MKLDMLTKRAQWDKGAIIFVATLFLASYIYQSIMHMRMSNDVEQETIEACEKNGGYDCELIHEYHDECFDSSYRAELRIREFRPREYRACIDSKVKQHSTGQD